MYPKKSAARRAAWARSAGTITVAGFAATLPVHALEVAAGDYEVVPAGVNLGMLYYQHATTSNLYVNGSKVSDNFKVQSDIALFRYIRPVQLGANTTLDLQAILPSGRLRGSGDAAALGSTSGFGDLILGAPVKFLLDPVSRDAISIGTYVYLPTGSYDSAKPLNLGENRWKALVQLAYVAHFGPRWALDTVGDVQLHGRNTSFGPGGSTRSQAARTELQTHLRYILSPQTALSAGLGHYRGGQTKIDGVVQNDALRTTYARLTATHFLDQTNQLQVQWGQDLSVHNGTKEHARINLRYVKIF